MASARTLIDDRVLDSAAASITFSDLGGYTKFRLTLYVIKDGSAGNLRITLNSTTSGYARQALIASGSSASAARVTSQANIEINALDSIGANQPALLTCSVSKPSASVPARVDGTLAMANSSGAIALDSSFAAEWNNTADLISSITILASSGNFAAGTRAVLEAV